MNIDIIEITEALLDTLFLLVVTSLFVLLIGLLVGFVLYFTEEKDSEDRKLITKVSYIVTSFIVDLARSIPFIILMIILIPITLLLMGTMLGAKAALPALIISAAPFFARLVYMSLKEIDKGKIEALEAMGAQRRTIIYILFKESLPSLISGFTVTLVTLIGFIASAGAIGAGGLGDLAKRKAYNGEYFIAYICVILVLVIVYTIQLVGDKISKKIDKR